MTRQVEAEKAYTIVEAAELKSVSPGGPGALTSDKRRISDVTT